MDYRLVKHGPETTKARYEIYIKWITVDGEIYEGYEGANLVTFRSLMKQCFNHFYKRRNRQ